MVYTAFSDLSPAFPTMPPSAPSVRSTLPPCCSLNLPNASQYQDLCTGCSFCLKCCSQIITWIPLTFPWVLL